jgi:hypothetical protein
MFTGKILILYILILQVAAVLLCAVLPVAALPPNPPDKQAESLIAIYHQIQERITKSPLVLPIHLETRVENNFSEVDIYGVVDYPFATIQKEFSKPRDWCDMIILHPNIRACTYSGTDSGWVLTLHNVNRYDQTITEAYQLYFKYNIISGTQSYVDMSMVADKGPFNSSDHKFRIRAAALDGKRSFVHLSYSYRYSPLQYIAIKSYIALFGTKRAGFSVESFTEENGPVYVSGVKGSIERNVMRYYLAILAYFDALKYPPEQRFEKRLSGWINLSDRYQRQFPRIEHTKYFENKRADLKNQNILQSAIPNR